ncbi:tumor necrosis factor a (TNF superfamily, member 2) [Gadus macrocephalus]|uniref:tumor necrosis factor a (TNF superfamily, member 2) n=1 Tax=Gadus macrocephalus TaxID=80720 RepID=UPI0028CB45BA|nr:tumor necrosis factor a (TNF superfamily, member 2) [Gadus macrocephalus]
MDVDCRVKMAAAGPSESQEPHQSAARTRAACHSGWKCGAALLAVALCVAGVLCFTLHKGAQEQSHSSEIDDLTRNLRQISSSVRAAIHLEGKYDWLNSSLQWKTQVDQYHSSGGLRLEYNVVVVPTNGLYFVYSQASFAIRCKAADHKGAELVHLTYMVDRWSNSYPEYVTILHSGRTVCQQAPPGGVEAGAKGKWYSAMYVGAVFHLNAGDRLRTVANKKLLPSVLEGNGKTFFGVFAL